jgi:hypothetical protein
LPTDSKRQFEVLFRLYGPKPALFEKTWKLPNLEDLKRQENDYDNQARNSCSRDFRRIACDGAEGAECGDRLLERSHLRWKSGRAFRSVARSRSRQSHREDFDDADTH